MESRHLLQCGSHSPGTPYAYTYTRRGERGVIVVSVYLFLCVCPNTELSLTLRHEGDGGCRVTHPRILYTDIRAQRPHTTAHTITVSHTGAQPFHISKRFSPASTHAIPTTHT